MTDSLLARAQLAIEESRKLQDQSRSLKVELESQREQLRLALFESAMGRSESKAYRDNRDKE
jgi:hypothetical protein